MSASRLLLPVLAIVAASACREAATPPAPALNEVAAVDEGPDPEGVCTAPAAYDGIRTAIGKRIGPAGSDLVTIGASTLAEASFSDPAVDAVDQQTGAVSCSATIALRAGPLAANMPALEGLRLELDGERVLARVHYRLQRAADTGKGLLTVDQDDGLAMLVIHAWSLTHPHGVPGVTIDEEGPTPPVAEGEPSVEGNDQDQEQKT